MPRKTYVLRLKRGLDLLASGTGLVVLSPVLVGLAAAELIFHGYPPLFSQERPGLRGHVFRMWKFRTMTNERGADGQLLSDAERLTAFGKLLRSTSLDELPELWNVLVGDMSLVGPRPLLVRYLERYSVEQMRRHDMPPGITGWAQVNGRNAVAWDERFALDIWYVENWSLALDLEILRRTIGKVLRRDGISEQGHVTQTEFLGTQLAEV